MNALSTHSNRLTINEQREKLLTENPDKLFGVYSLIQDEECNMELKLIEDVLTLYPNQLESITWLDTSDIRLLDINQLRKGEAVSIEGGVTDIKNPILLSGWVIEIYWATTQAWPRDHILLTLRDGATVDNLAYTSIAWRNTGENLLEEAEREQAEESPFLLKDADGKYTLGMRSTTVAFIETLKSSIKTWKEKIQRYQWDESKTQELAEAEKFVKKLFPGIEGGLSWMIQILEDIVERGAFVEYSAESLDTYTGIETSMKTIKIWGYSWRFYVFHDEANNTIEYRKLERVTGIPEWYTLAGRWTSRLYLESVNQRPNTRRLRDNHDHQAAKKVVPAVQGFIDSVLKSQQNSSN